MGRLPGHMLPAMCYAHLLLLILAVLTVCCLHPSVASTVVTLSPSEFVWGGATQWQDWTTIVLEPGTVYSVKPKSIFSSKSGLLLNGSVLVSGAGSDSTEVDLTGFPSNMAAFALAPGTPNENDRCRVHFKSIAIIMVNTSSYPYYPCCPWL